MEVAPGCQSATCHGGKVDTGPAQAGVKPLEPQRYSTDAEGDQAAIARTLRQHIAATTGVDVVRLLGRSAERQLAGSNSWWVVYADELVVRKDRWDEWSTGVQQKLVDMAKIVAPALDALVRPPGG